MHKHISWIVFWIAVWTCFINPLQAEEKSPIDKLQSQARTETIHSTRLFLNQIAGLALDVQQRLMRARFTNTILHFDVDDSFKTKTEGFVYGSSLKTKKESWSLTFGLYDIRNYDHSWKRHNSFEFTVNITPNSDMLEWMRARDEFAEYSTQKIEDHNLTLNVFGFINSFTLEKNHFENSKKLSMNLSPYTVKEFTCGDPSKGGFRGSLSDHTKLLRAEIAKWVKFYMGKGEKPELISCLK